MKKQKICQYVALFFLMMLIVTGCDNTEVPPVHEGTIAEVSKSSAKNFGTDWTMNPANGYSYRLTEHMSWMEAEAQAQEWGGHLVTLNSWEEELWIKETFGENEHIWIGFNDIDEEGIWVWSSGDPVTYTKWAEVEPNDCGGPGPDCESEDAAVMNWCWKGAANPNDPCLGDYWNDLHIDGHHRGVVEKTVFEISVDIKPGSDPNSINIKSKGVISVAVLTSLEFDAASVNPNTVTLGNGDGSDTPVAKKKGNLMANLEDVDDDGDLDLVLHFETQALVENGDLCSFTTDLILTGKTHQGDDMQGSDNVRIVGKTKDCLPPPFGLVAWWPGDANTDDIVGGYNGELVGGATYDVGLVDEAFSLDGIDDFVNVPHNEELNVGTEDFTIDFLVNFRSIAGEQIMVEKWIQKGLTSPGNPIGWSYTKIGSSIRFTFSNTELGEYPIDVDPSSIPTDTWIHVAATRSMNTYTLFWNGEPIRSETLTQTYNLDSDSSVKFGHRGNPEDTPGSDDERGFYLNGLIDEIGMYNRALSAEEIMEIYLAGGAGKCKNGF